MKRISMPDCLLCAVLAVCLGGCAKSELVRTHDHPVPASSAQPPANKTNTTQEQAAAPSEANQPALAGASAAGQSEMSPASADRLQSALSRIHFSFDSFDLSPDARGTLQKNAGLLKADPQAMVIIEGHCDERGSAEYNLALGERRALAAKKYLVTLGVPEHLLSTISYGEEKPIDQGHAEDAWEKNRRDEFVVKSGPTSR